MKRIALFIGIIAIIVVGFFVYKNSHVDIIGSHSGDVTIPVGKTGRVKGLRITFREMIQDNRCPVDVQCIEAGAVTVAVILSDGEHTEVRNQASDEVPYAFGSYLVSIGQVLPDAHSEMAIDPESYIVTFHVDESSEEKRD